MGNAESTLSFKTRFNELSTRADLTIKDPIWQFLINSCVDHQQVFGVLSAAQIRQVRDTNPQNLEILLETMASHLTSLIKPSGIGPALEEQILSCMRALERIIPVVYEKKDYAEAIERLLWSADGIMLGLLDTLVRLSQQPGFCIPLQGSTLWAAGIGAESVIQPSKQNQYNKCELLRLLLVVLGEPLYCLAPHGLDALATKPVKDIASLFCSLLNTGIQTASMSFFTANPGDLALTALMILSVHHSKSTNNFRKLLSKIYRENDLQVLQDRLSEKLDTPSASLLWELTQANTKFEMVPAAQIVDQIIAHRHEKREDDFVRILTFILIRQSAEQQWCAANARTMMRLFTPFNDATIHITALLDLLYNISPHAQIDTPDDVEQFSGFVHAVMISSNAEHKRALASSVRHLLRENKPLIFSLRDLQTGDVWLDQYFNHVREGHPQTLQQVQIPPMANIAEFDPIKFHWDSAKLRWYFCVLWGQAMQCAEIRKGVSPWSHTDVRLFKVETVQDRPSLRNPKGAVEAIGEVLWSWVKR